MRVKESFASEKDLEKDQRLYMNNNRKCGLNVA